MNTRIKSLRVYSFHNFKQKLMSVIPHKDVYIILNDFYEDPFQNNISINVTLSESKVRNE
jgi:hypothetical protein